MLQKIIASILLTLLAGSSAPTITQVTRHPAALNIGSESNLSYNWAGYTASTGPYTGIGASWTVPDSTSLSKTQTSIDATWIGIGGVATGDLIQAGTQTIINANGQTTYQAWYEILPGASQVVPLTVKPGDAIIASITQQTQNTWAISFSDTTTNAGYQISVPYSSSLASADWIEEMPSINNQFAALNNFDAVQFGNAWTVQNGSRINLVQAGAKAMTMVNAQNQVLVQPSAIGSDGASFSVTRAQMQQYQPTPTPSSVPLVAKISIESIGYAAHSRHAQFRIQDYFKQWMRSFKHAQTRGRD